MSIFTKMDIIKFSFITTFFIMFILGLSFYFIYKQRVYIAYAKKTGNSSPSYIKKSMSEICNDPKVDVKSECNKKNIAFWVFIVSLIMTIISIVISIKY